MLEMLKNEQDQVVEVIMLVATRQSADGSDLTALSHACSVRLHTRIKDASIATCLAQEAFRLLSDPATLSIYRAAFSATWGKLHPLVANATVLRSGHTVGAQGRVSSLIVCQTWPKMT